MVSFKTIIVFLSLFLLFMGLSFSTQASESEYRNDTGMILTDSTDKYDIFVFNTQDDFLQVTIIDE